MKLGKLIFKALETVITIGSVISTIIELSDAYKDYREKDDIIEAEYTVVD